VIFKKVFEITHKIQNSGYYLWQEGEGKRQSGLWVESTIWNILSLKLDIIWLFYYSFNHTHSSCALFYSEGKLVK
jgi:hypothetical protein